MAWDSPQPSPSVVPRCSTISAYQKHSPQTNHPTVIRSISVPLCFVVTCMSIYRSRFHNSLLLRFRIVPLHPLPLLLGRCYPTVEVVRLFPRTHGAATSAHKSERRRNVRGFEVQAERQLVCVDRNGLESLTRCFVVTASPLLSTLWGCPLVSPAGTHPALSALPLRSRMLLPLAGLSRARLGAISSALTDLSCAVVVYAYPPFHCALLLKCSECMNHHFVVTACPPFSSPPDTSPA